MKKILRSRRILLLTAGLIIVASAVMVFVFTGAKYTSQETQDGEIVLEHFEVYEKLYITDGDTVTELVPISGNGEKYYEVTPENFNKLKMDLVYDGDAITNCRFRFDMLWYKENGADNNSIFHGYPDFTIDEDMIYNNTEHDNWFYFKDYLSGKADTNADPDFEEIVNGQKVYHVLKEMTSDAGDNLHDPQNPDDIPEKVRIYVTIDCVQYNRTKQVWGITEFPWE